jgi:dehydrogenase/reductase SDR family protein 12
MELKRLLGALAFYGRFTLSFTQVGHAVRRLAWSRLTPDLRGQHWLVTGGSGGLGRAMTLAALRAGATVTVAARNPDRLREIAAEAAADGLAGLDTERCDFTSTADTARLAARLVAQGRRIDALMNNVGVLNDALVVTSEGREASFVSNLLSHYQLTEALIDGGQLASGSVVVNVTSGGGYAVPLTIAMLDVTDPARYNGTAAYAFHKRAQMALNQHWRDAHGGRGIEFYVMHPGWADTAGVQRSLPRFRKALRPILRDGKSGADTAVWLAATRPAQRIHDGVWFDRKLRPAHVYGHTRQTPDTPASLADFLRSALDKGPA